MKISSEQLKKDIDYLSVFLEDKEQIDEVIGACDKFGPEDVEKLHDPLYLDISEFNYLNWEGN